VNDEGPDWREIPWPKKLLARIAGEVVKSLEVARLGMGPGSMKTMLRIQGVKGSRIQVKAKAVRSSLEPWNP
jgi:hypothetical protein